MRSSGGGKLRSYPPDFGCFPQKWAIASAGVDFQVWRSGQKRAAHVPASSVGISGKWAKSRRQHGLGKAAFLQEDFGAGDVRGPAVGRQGQVGRFWRRSFFSDRLGRRSGRCLAVVEKLGGTYGLIFGGGALGALLDCSSLCARSYLYFIWAPFSWIFHFGGSRRP